MEEEWKYLGRILQFGLEDVGGIWISGDAFLGRPLIFESDEWVGLIEALRWKELQDSAGYRARRKMVPWCGGSEAAVATIGWIRSRSREGWLVRLARLGFASRWEHQWWRWAEKNVQMLNHWILTTDSRNLTGREWRGLQTKGPNVVKGQERGGPEGMELLQEPKSRVWQGV